MGTKINLFLSDGGQGEGHKGKSDKDERNEDLKHSISDLFRRGLNAIYKRRMIYHKKYELKKGVDALEKAEQSRSDLP